MIKINEIYYSIQGESSRSGLPTVFVRLTYCNLRCSYCDSEYAFYDGTDMTIDDIVDDIKKYNCNLVEITGGEPLFQNEVLDLMKLLCDLGFEVMLETSGSLPIKDVDKRVMLIMDLKCPSSKMMKKNLYENLDFIKPSDEIKFVVENREDYEWSKEIVGKFKLLEKCTILFSVVFGKLEPVRLVEWILEDKNWSSVPSGKLRYQLQMHKYIWEPTAKGV
jgi:7-carboxy-7-deazaguanine synthase